MPKKKELKSTPVKHQAQPARKAKHGLSTPFKWIIAGVVTAIVLGLGGTAWYMTYYRPFHLPAITVDDVTLNMNYLLQRARLAESDSLSQLTSLAKEEIIKKEAPNYGITVSEADIEAQIRSYANGTTSNLTDAEFKEWYRQRLNSSGLSDSDYRGMVKVSLIEAKLQEYLAARMPTTALHVHLHDILVATIDEANAARVRLDNGESFESIANEVSLDSESNTKGGDLGWFPRGVLTIPLENTAFEIATGNISDPVPLIDESAGSTDPSGSSVVGYYLLKVTEKDENRAIDPDFIPTLQSQLLEKWYGEVMAKHDVSYHGLHGGFDSETYAWLQWQLSKGKATTTSSSS
jgi:hypothetical protein